MHPPGRPNRLANESSPYLRQHATNPVDWYPWGDEALRRAREEQRPILLSVGYSACHWCHVMAHESFEDPVTAALMNAHFVNVKVDREERPDLDQIYQGVVQLMGGQGGWPLTVFLTPDLVPFYGGTYFPPEPRHGMPSFRMLLDALSRAWTEKREEVLAQAGEFKNGLQQLATYGLGTLVTPVSGDDVAAAGKALARALDPVEGGFGGAPKFPNTMGLALLLRAWRRSGERGAPRGRAPHAGPDGDRRHPRPARRRVPPLQRGPLLAGAPLREDALRQRAAAPPARRGAAGLAARPTGWRARSGWSSGSAAR